MGKLNDGRSKKRGRNYFKAVPLVKPQNTILPSCKICGGWPATRRHHANGDALCDKCAESSFNTYLKTLLAGCIVLLLCSMIFLIYAGEKKVSKNKHKSEISFVKTAK